MLYCKNPEYVELIHFWSLSLNSDGPFIDLNTKDQNFSLVMQGDHWKFKQPPELLWNESDKKCNYYIEM